MNLLHRHTMSVFNQHRHETDGFTLDYESASDDFIFDLKPVSSEFLQSMEQILKTVHPKHLTATKKTVSYLIGLRHRQQVAWEAKLKEFKTRLNNTKQWVQNHA